MRQLYRTLSEFINVLFIYCPIVRASKLNLKAFTGKIFSLFIFNIDVLFIYCPIVTAVCTRYYCTDAEQVLQLYTFMQQSHLEVKSCFCQWY